MMEELTTALILFALAFTAFVFAFGVLRGLGGSCSGRCDESGRPLCGYCPRRDAEDAVTGGGR